MIHDDDELKDAKEYLSGLRELSAARHSYEQQKAYAVKIEEVESEIDEYERKEHPAASLTLAAGFVRLCSNAME
jgi:hypothetical protein